MSEAQLKTSLEALSQNLLPGNQNHCSFDFQLKEIDDSIKQVIKCALVAAEIKNNECLDMLDSGIRELLDAKQRLLLMQQSVDTLANKTSENISDFEVRTTEMTFLLFLLYVDENKSLLDIYTQIFKELIQEYEEKSDYGKYGTQGEYIEFKKTIWHEQNTDGSDFPSMKTFFNVMNTEEQEADEVMVYSATFDNRCPLTLQPIVHPILSTACNHFYEKDAILSLLNPTCVCPVVGCEARLQRSLLKEDEILERRLRRAQEISNLKEA
nr:hypothetical zinc finger protein - fission yeast (Schizosaccharomyces pombe) [Schizosaccharomyces pombe]